MGALSSGLNTLGSIMTEKGVHRCWPRSIAQNRGRQNISFITPFLQLETWHWNHGMCGPWHWNLPMPWAPQETYQRQERGFQMEGRWRGSLAQCMHILNHHDVHCKYLINLFQLSFKTFLKIKVLKIIDSVWLPAPYQKKNYNEFKNIQMTLSHHICYLNT